MSQEKMFDDILSAENGKGAEALDILVEKLNFDKERFIYNFLGNRGSEDVLWALLHMLSSKTMRVASNATYVLGSLAETELGSHRILSILSLAARKKSITVLEDLTQMLTVEDAETVMNAAGTLGTLAETEEGRQWMLTQPCIGEMLTNITFLLGSDSHWTASNSALVLARLTISQSGSQVIFDHPRSKYILTRLVQSLGNDSAGRGMNSAFAVGRLLDTKVGKDRLLNNSDTEKMITSLCRMLSKGDMGGAKNACFALSCLATDADGNQRVLSNNLFQDVLARLVLLLRNDEDTEAAWFAAMTLKTISTHKQGVIRLRQNSDIVPALVKTLAKTGNSKELNEEIEKTLMHLKKLDRPDPPSVEICSSTTAKVAWNAVNTESGLPIVYKLYCDNTVIYKGQDLQQTVDNLRPFTSYLFKVRASTLGDDSSFSEHVTVMTHEDVPSAPRYLRVIGVTPTQLRLTWNSPENHNGILTAYHVFVGDRLVDAIPDTSYIITRLSAATRYTVHVCASTSTGLGEKATVVAVTEELGAHAPGKPALTVLGRNEIHVAWMPPSVPLGRFFRYELCMNDRVVYQGTDKVFKATGLTPDTEYTFAVVAITSGGRCISDPTKKRTPKDKPQNEPGHHQLKTHSFMAKEFQIMQEKSKSQSNLLPPTQKAKQKPKLQRKNSNRPSSSMSTSNASDTSALTEGTWAVSTGGSGRAEEYEEREQIVGAEIQTKQPMRKFQNSAVLGGAPLKKATPSYSASAQVVTAHAAVVDSDAMKPQQSMEAKEKRSGQRPNQDVASVTQTPSVERTSRAPPKEFTFDKERGRQPKISSTTRQRARLHRGHAIIKGKKLLKSDKELLAEMSRKPDQTDSKQHKPPETDFGQRSLPYYPDIVSAIRKQYGSESTVDVDFVNGKLQRRKSSSTPDSLNAEPGTARYGDVSPNFVTGLEVPPIKPLLPHHFSRDRHMNEYQLHEIAKRRSYPHRSMPGYPLSKFTSGAANVHDHVIIKSTPTSKFGLKYTHGFVPGSSELSADIDSAFQSFSSLQNGHEAHSAAPYLQKPVQLQPIRTDHLPRSSSERYLSADPSESRAISSRLKTPSKGYWSDHDAPPTRPRNKAPVLTPINYKTFQGAHRPAKSIRLESALVTSSDTGTWLVADSVPNGDNNRYKFVPTQWRTQPANLPTPGRSGRLNYRLESLNDVDRRLEVPDKNTTRSASVTSGGITPSPPSQRRPVRNSTGNRTSKSMQLHDSGSYKTSEPKGVRPDIYRENISKPFYNLKTGSIVPHHHGYDDVTSFISSQHTRSPQATGRLPHATATAIPHTLLSPLTPSEPSVSSSSGSLPRHPSQSPRLKMTSTSSSFYGSTIPTATGYAISPTDSPYHLQSGGKHMAHLQHQMALIPGGGDPV